MEYDGIMEMSKFKVFEAYKISKTWKGEAGCVAGSLQPMWHYFK